MPEYNKLWDSVLAQIEVSTSKANFSTWFKNTAVVRQDAGVIFVAVPNPFFRDWLADKYHKLILRALRDLSPEIRSIEYIIAKPDDKRLAKASQESEAPVTAPALDTGLGLNDLYLKRDSNLNPRYLFESFIVGPFNEVAYAAAQAVVKNPGTNYNPLFIYGGTGLGKTHLIQAVGNQIKLNNPERKIFYLTSEAFVTDYINSMHSNQANWFKDKYRKYDVLIMDDVQFMSNKEKSQEELFHLFNVLHDNNKQIIFSSDKPPKFIPNLEDRLRSRFEGGMIVDINRPDYESRLAILKAKMQNQEFSPTEEIIEYVASVVQDSIRELEGAINSVIVQSQAKKRQLTLPEVKALIKSNLRPQKTVSIKDVMRVVAGFYNIEEHSLYEKTRRKEVVKPRQIIMYILREDFSTSYPYIGQKLGGRDHTTVIHACNKIKEDSKHSTALVQELDQIRTLLYNTV